MTREEQPTMCPRHGSMTASRLFRRFWWVTCIYCPWWRRALQVLRIEAWTRRWAERHGDGR